MASSLPARTAEFLAANSERIAGERTVVGLDGFVDSIIHVVRKRQSATEFQRLERMDDFGQLIKEASGLSMNFEFVTQLEKLGGNGPIMANALLDLGFPLTYVGLLGRPNIHPVFEEFAQRAEVVSIEEPGYTDAVEFVDGKLMLGKHASLANATWETLTSLVPVERLRAMFGEARLVALVNWTMLPFMSQIFERLLGEVVPALGGRRRWIFFDLADPSKRTHGDIERALQLIREFERGFGVILGLNFNESRQIGDVLGLRSPEMEHDAVVSHAEAIRECLAVDTVVVHPSAFAAAADAGSKAAVNGPYTSNPKITTGAGDHFNAGFCLGRILGADLESSLQLGVATSGYYVRNAASPSATELRDFLASL